MTNARLRITTNTNSGASIDWSNVDFGAVFGEEDTIARAVHSAGITRDSLKKKVEISPTLYFKFAKSKLTKLEQKDFKQRVQHLMSMLNYAKSMNQLAIYDDCSIKLASIFQEQELIVAGIDRFLYEKDIIRYITNVKDKVVKFKEFTEFPRVVPTKIRKIYHSLKDKDLFDEYWIAYIDYKEEIKSNKQKIREKDPILFGKLRIEPTKLYFIADWIDEYCDLTLDQLTNSLKKLDKDYKVEVIDEVNQRDIFNLKNEILSKQKRLDSANPNNFRALMQQENVGFFRSIFNFKKWKNK